MPYCRLGDYEFRIVPSSVVFPFSVDTSVTQTVGGRVVQVYGITTGDMVVQGLLGQERRGLQDESWRLAETFQAAIGRIVRQQSQIPTTGQLAGYDSTAMHPPVRFVFNDDSPERRAAGLPIHNWDFMVYVKGFQDTDQPGYTVTHKTGKFSYGYTLTLFIVEDLTRNLRQVAMDKFISRLATGVGWKRTVYNGPMTIEELEAYVAANSPDGTIHGLVLKRFQDAAAGEATLPGGSATSDAAGTPPASNPTGSAPGG